MTCLTKDRDALLAFYAFPADHWDPLRTVRGSNAPLARLRDAPHPDRERSGRASNPWRPRPSLATVRHRTVRTKGALSQKTAKLMVFKLVQSAAKTWRRLKGANQLPEVIEGIFTDGVATRDTETRAA